ncbi:two-component system response regulator CreB, partial [Rhizobium leguminosarum]|uniref:winged helix-turn-helix domain-containing protein n=1 Tax=Rhizobium leguminosarum TaxID=384 RepID=UPI0013DAA605
NEAGPDRRHATLVAGVLSLDRRGRAVMFNESTIAMTALEFAILDAFLSRPDMVFSREQLMEAAYGAGTYVADRTIDSHIRNIRAKFLAAGGSAIIATVHGIGFKLGIESGRKA